MGAVEGAADDRLDDHLVDLIPLMDAIPQLEFLRADKGTRDGFPCWDVQLTIITTT